MLTSWRNNSGRKQREAAAEQRDISGKKAINSPDISDKMQQ
jgi:hypothetical protein